MGIFTELSILYSKYRPEKREFEVTNHKALSKLNPVNSDGAFEALRLAHQHPEGYSCCREGTSMA
jgi:hypothetical protein